MKKSKRQVENDSKISKVMAVPGRIKETKEIIEKEINRQTKGRVMKALIKFLFKLIFKLILIAAALIGSVIALNKFAPDVFDSLTDWLKDNRNE
jgi:hypothetical protein